MNRHLLLAALSIAGWLVTPGSSLAQSRDKIVFVNVPLGTGVGQYNSLGFVTGTHVRYQYPLRANVVLVGRSGLDLFLVKGRYSEYFRQNNRTTLGFSIPVTVGPRVYLLDGLHAGLNVGVDIGINALALSVFHFEPAAGYVLRLPDGRYVDVGTSVVTSLNRGSGAYLFHFAYGLGNGR